jgi:hypothetical protein
MFDSDQQLKIPSDLAGVTLATYKGRRRDNNLVAAVGEACDPIRAAIRRQGLLIPVPHPFWAPFVNEGAILVVGRFLEFQSFEQSGLLGAGDAVALTEISTYLRRIGCRDISVMYADRLDGDMLNTDLVLIGGVDANLMTYEVVSRINTNLRWGNPSRYEISFSETLTQSHWGPTFRVGGRLINDCGVVLRSVNPPSPSPGPFNFPV